MHSSTGRKYSFYFKSNTLSVVHSFLLSWAKLNVFLFINHQTSVYTKTAASNGKYYA